MEIPKKIIYNGETFFLQTSGKYYQSGNKNKEERLLHRRIWIDNFGPIPTDYCIHHKDGDWTNNELSNMEIILSRQHSKDHLLKRLEDKEFFKKNRENLDKATIEAAKWHKSEEGRAWHKKHGREAWVGRKPFIEKCQLCGKEFKTYFPTRMKMCSSACYQKDRAKVYCTAKDYCKRCGKEFIHNKFRKQEYCSHTCANRYPRS